MSLGERIKAQRKRCGMSQEKVAELTGVSRQAVAKWESGQSSPSTENLFRLEEIFGTTTDILLDTPAAGSGISAEQVCALYRADQAVQTAERLTQRRRNLLVALAVVGAYLLVYLLGRVFCTMPGSYSLTGWLLGDDPRQFSYLYGWLLHQRLFWIALLLSALPCLWGKYRFSAVTTAAFALGLLLGELLGPDPAGAPWGHGHDGWAIWGGIFLYSIVMGIALEGLFRRGLLRKGRPLWLWCILFVLGSAAIILLIKLGTPVPTGT